MAMLLRSLWTISATCLLASCSAPTSICDMPSNEHFWQGLDVQWQGQIEYHSPSIESGPFLAFFDKNCLTGIRVDPIVVDSIISRSSKFVGDDDVADFLVRGHIIYLRGTVVLEPTFLQRRSAWLTYENGGFQTYVKDRVARAKLLSKR